MANEANLIPFSRMPPERQKELSRKGGLASVQARRKKREQARQIILRDSALQQGRLENLQITCEAVKLLHEVRREMEEVKLREAQLKLREAKLTLREKKLRAKESGTRK